MRRAGGGIRVHLSSPGKSLLALQQDNEVVQSIKDGLFKSNLSQSLISLEFQDGFECLEAP